MDNQYKKQNNLEKYRVDGMSLKQKADKIAAALHMVTDCIEDNEPIRFKLRSLSVELASDAHTLMYAPSRDRGYIFSELELVATEIMSFLSIARSVQMISGMNADILLRELSQNTERMRTWTETGFYEAEGAALSTSRPAFTLTESNFQTEDALPPQENKATEFMLPKKSSDTFSSKGHEVEQHIPKPAKPAGAADARKFDFAMKLNRKNAILKIIKDKKEVTIKDISEIISDCSEKTIQRELITLVGEGVLKKVGEKRWSKYMLA